MSSAVKSQPKDSPGDFAKFPSNLQVWQLMTSLDSHDSVDFEERDDRTRILCTAFSLQLSRPWLKRTPHSLISLRFAVTCSFEASWPKSLIKTSSIMNHKQGDDIVVSKINDRSTH